MKVNIFSQAVLNWTTRKKNMVLCLTMKSRETLSGYIIRLLRNNSAAKERIIIGDYEFDILNVFIGTRIETVKMKKLK
ncbi:MAG: hypothetical protein IPM85_09665 [Chitinophagaceae bacterium]|nr:hypothetical protein [Chitinophagaceae bacterium]